MAHKGGGHLFRRRERGRGAVLGLIGGQGSLSLRLHRGILLLQGRLGRGGGLGEGVQDLRLGLHDGLHHPARSGRAQSSEGGVKVGLWGSASCPGRHCAETHLVTAAATGSDATALATVLPRLEVHWACARVPQRPTARRMTSEARIGETLRGRRRARGEGGDKRLLQDPLGGSLKGGRGASLSSVNSACPGPGACLGSRPRGTCSLEADCRRARRKLRRPGRCVTPPPFRTTARRQLRSVPRPLSVSGAIQASDKTPGMGTMSLWIVLFAVAAGVLRPAAAAAAAAPLALSLNGLISQGVSQYTASISTLVEASQAFKASINLQMQNLSAQAEELISVLEVSVPAQPPPQRLAGALTQLWLTRRSCVVAGRVLYAGPNDQLNGNARHLLWPRLRPHLCHW